MRQSIVTGHGYAGIVLINELNTTITLLVALENGDGGIGGTVIDGQHLEILETLVEERIHACAYVFFLVIYRNDHRDLRHAPHSPHGSMAYEPPMADCSYVYCNAK